MPKKPASTKPRAFAHHDHGACATSALDSARRTCIERDLKLTPVREKVLNILLESHAAIGAYDILERLALEGFRSQPPIAYRALDFLVEHGFVHKIERLNAFIACTHSDEGHSPAFMICKQCHQVAEAMSVPISSTLGKAAKTIGFSIDKTVLEAEGMCPRCQQNETP
jgi:Fur family zinc uptake transcriptional regulator